MNPSTTTLDLNVGYPSVATICHAVQGDIQARIITANLYDGGVQWVPPSGAIGTIRFRTPLGTSGFYDTDEEGNTAVTWVGNVATLRIVQNAIAVAGDVPMQLSFYDGNGQVLTTFLWETLVQPSVLTDTQFMQTDYYNLLSKQINAVIGAAVYPPIINPTTRNWMLWDTETNSYVDSGYSSVGAKGDQGDQGVSITRIQRTSGTGEAGTNDTYTVYLSDGTTAGTFIVHNGSNGTNGLSIGRIEKTSGTGAAGTTDTYTVYLSNNTSVGTFTVYNGSDGEGSPGTQPPLMDGDQAAVGTAIKYAREDHVHPRDSTLKAGIDDLEEIVGDGSLSGFTATNLTGAANELKGSLTSIGNIQNVGRLDNTSITAQIDALPVPSADGAVYFGTILGTAVGVPVATSGNVVAYVYTSGYKKIYYYPISSNDDAYVIVRTTNGWGSWIKLPTRSDVGTLQTNVGALQTNVGTLQTDVGALQTGISQYANVIQSASGKTEHTINLPSASAHFIVFYAEALTTYGIMFAGATSNGIVSHTDISIGTGSGAPNISTDTNKIIVAYNTERNIHLLDFCLFGNFCTLS